MLKYIIKTTTEMQRKNNLLMCYIQNNGKRNEKNVHYVHIKYREVFGLVTSGLLVLVVAFLEHNTELYAEYITS